ncbi:unnamed protein product, partial [Discosporangium mesarthrocarpum]
RPTGCSNSGLSFNSDGGKANLRVRVALALNDMNHERMPLRRKGGRGCQLILPLVNTMPWTWAWDVWAMGIPRSYLLASALAIILIPSYAEATLGCCGPEWNHVKGSAGGGHFHELQRRLAFCQTGPSMLIEAEWSQVLGMRRRSSQATGSSLSQLCRMAPRSKGTHFLQMDHGDYGPSGRLFPTGQDLCLDLEQEECISLDPDTPAILLTAGAGTGKTHTLAARLTRLLHGLLEEQAEEEVEGEGAGAGGKSGDVRMNQVEVVGRDWGAGGEGGRRVDHYSTPPESFLVLSFTKQ